MGGGGYERISCFNVPKATSTVHVLYCGGVHYDALVPTSAVQEKKAIHPGKNTTKLQSWEQKGNNSAKFRPSLAASWGHSQHHRLSPSLSSHTPFKNKIKHKKYGQKNSYKRRW